MITKRKDSANSFAQTKWNHASAEYARMMKWIDKYEIGHVLRRRAEDRIVKLVGEYPNLGI